jgi:transcription initiation factor IIE alpha subunit
MEKTLIVDAENFTIQKIQSQEKILSREIVRALAFLIDRKTVDFSEYLREVFQFSFYDSYLHRQKVFNSLQKVKKVLPSDIKIVSRYEKIYLEGEVEQIAITRPSPTEQRPAVTQDEALLTLLKSAKQSSLRRNEIQTQLAISKRAALRILADLEERGLVAKRGRGRTTKYVVLSMPDGPA